MRSITLTVALLFVSAAALAGLGQRSGAPRINNTVFTLPDGGEITYGISVPDEADGNASPPRPLVLALHPGGGRTAYYGSSFMRGIVEPALRSWNAIIVAPDAPTRSWASEDSEQGVIALLEDVMSRHAIDRTRVLVTGFSMGGRGTWFFATRNPNLFTGAIPIAGSPRDTALDGLGAMPVHIIHSRDDEVVPYSPAADTAEQLRGRNHPVELTELVGVGHFTMGAYIEPLQRAGAWMMERWGNE